VIKAEGWYVDPFAQHQLRWFSDGNPTALVQDAGIDGHDDPPAATWDGPLQDLDEVPTIDETLRAGDEPDAQDLDEAGHYG
jgi:hypothetical protein